MCPGVVFVWVGWLVCFCYGLIVGLEVVVLTSAQKSTGEKPYVLDGSALTGCQNTSRFKCLTPPPLNLTYPGQAILYGVLDRPPKLYLKMFRWNGLMHKHSQDTP